MLEFLKASFLILHISYYVLMTFMMLYLILLFMIYAILYLYYSLL